VPLLDDLPAVIELAGHYSGPSAVTGKAVPTDPCESGHGAVGVRVPEAKDGAALFHRSLLKVIGNPVLIDAHYSIERKNSLASIPQSVTPG